jgi:hypothetical protein
MEHDMTVQLLTQLAELRAIVEGQRSGWFTLAAAALAGSFGFLAAWVPNAFLEKKRRQHDAHSLRSALIAEMVAMSKIIRSRRYIEALRSASEAEGATRFSVNVPADYALVYKANVTKLGLLDAKDAACIVHSYKLLESVVQDVTSGGVLAEGLGYPEAYLQDAQYLETVLEAADDLARRYST